MSPHKNKILLTLKEITPALFEKHGITRIGIFGSVAGDYASQARRYFVSQDELFIGFRKNLVGCMQGF